MATLPSHPHDLASVDCVGYVRVSTERQAGEVYTSLGDQEAAIVTLAARTARTVGAWYRDEGASGATVAQRPALCALLSACAASPRPARAPGLVLVLNDSRFGRFPDPEEATYWRVHLSKLGWTVRFVESDESENKTARSLLRAIGSAQATEYRDNIRRNAKRGSRGTASQGFWVSRTPFGYRRQVVYPAGRDRVLEQGQRKAPDERVALVPQEGEAAIVRELFRRYATGTESLATLTEWLIVTCPGRKWTRPAVKFTLTNPAYLGDVVAGRVPGDRAERAVTPIRPTEEWYGKRDSHVAIVSRGLFAAVQSELQRKRRATRSPASDWFLTGIVRCRCGKTLAGGGHGGRRGKQTRFYRCSSKGAHPSGRCEYPGAIAKHLLEPALLDLIGKVVGTPAATSRLAHYIDSALAAVHGAAVPTVDSIDREQATLETKRQRLLSAVENGTITSFEAKDRLTEIRGLLGALQARRDWVSRASVASRTIFAERDRLLALASDFRAAAARLKGAELRELVRPWVRHAVFDTARRVLTVEVCRLPALPNDVLLSRMPCPPCARPPAQD